MSEREEFRDRAAFAALTGMLAKGEGGCISKAAAEAYEYADALLAARELPGRYEKFADGYRREAAREEKERAECEARRIAFGPLHEWAKENWSDCYIAVLFDFVFKYKPKAGEDVIEAFKDWVRKNNPGLIEKQLKGKP
jgi:hypothetical protein